METENICARILYVMSSLKYSTRGNYKYNSIHLTQLKNMTTYKSNTVCAQYLKFPSNPELFHSYFSHNSFIFRNWREFPSYKISYILQHIHFLHGQYIGLYEACQNKSPLILF